MGEGGGDLWRTGLSRRRMIWLLLHPHPLSHISTLSLFLSLLVRHRFSILTEVGRGGGETNHTTARSLVLYKSFNTLWSLLFYMVTALIRRDPLRQCPFRQHGRGGGILSSIFYLLYFYIFHLFFCIFTDFCPICSWNFCVIYFLNSFSQNYKCCYFFNFRPHKFLTKFTSKLANFLYLCFH